MFSVLYWFRLAIVNHCLPENSKVQIIETCGGEYYAQAIATPLWILLFKDLLHQSLPTPPIIQCLLQTLSHGCHMWCPINKKTHTWHNQIESPVFIHYRTNVHFRCTNLNGMICLKLSVLFSFLSFSFSFLSFFPSIFVCETCVYCSP